MSLSSNVLWFPARLFIFKIGLKSVDSNKTPDFFSWNLECSCASVILSTAEDNSFRVLELDFWDTNEKNLNIL